MIVENCSGASVTLATGGELTKERALAVIAGAALTVWSIYRWPVGDAGLAEIHTSGGGFTPVALGCKQCWGVLPQYAQHGERTGAPCAARTCLILRHFAIVPVASFLSAPTRGSAGAAPGSSPGRC